MGSSSGHCGDDLVKNTIHMRRQASAFHIVSCCFLFLFLSQPTKMQSVSLGGTTTITAFEIPAVEDAENNLVLTFVSLFAATFFDRCSVSCCNWCRPRSLHWRHSVDSRCSAHEKVSYTTQHTVHILNRIIFLNLYITLDSN